MQAVTIFKEVATICSELLYPSHCTGCGVALFEKSGLCEGCWSGLKRLSEARCEICSYERSAPLLSSGPCENCGGRELHFKAAVAAFRYQGLVCQLLHQFKYGGDQSLKKMMGELVGVAMQEECLSGIHFEAVVPVPLHRLREREREFNQAKMLAEEVALRSTWPMKDLLCRNKPTSTQVSSHRQERIENLKGAFALKKRKELFGNYLLVDDVLTTGATLDECAKVLLEAGADAVWALTVARS